MDDKLKMHSINKVDENIKRIGEMFPNCLTERLDEDGKPEVCIDFDMLKQELSSEVVEGNAERYQFTWPGKKKSILLANAPISATLRPCREESVDFENTENLYIEGDNLDVLKLLQETYLNKINIIYIDPPYNTGSDFVYNDDFKESSEEYMENSGQFDDDGNRLFQNTESNGRFHTDWLNMLYPRLKIAHDLLSDDGVIFISIDDNEQENLKKCCDELFGRRNFLAQVVWERAYAPINLKKHFSQSHDYVLCYAKNIELAVCNGLQRNAEQNKDYKNPDNDPRGPWKAGNPSVGPAVEKNIYEIVSPSGRKMLPPSGRSWLYSKERFKEMLEDNRIYWGKDGNSVWAPKMFLSEVKNSVTPMTIWKYTEVGHSQDATKKLKELFDGQDYFDYPKPVDLIKRCIQLYSKKDSIILDFFSGSATTAHSTMQLNSEDDGNRIFIMVQLPEKTDRKSEAYKEGYENICEIGKERIRRAGAKIKENSPITTTNLDIGFRVLKLDSSNMKEVYYNPANYVPSMFESLADNIKDDRSAEDLLFQVMLDLGVLLSNKIEETEIAGKKVFSVADAFLIACFDANLTDEVITEIAKKKPYYFVTRDHSMASDSVATNFEQIFATYSPETVRKIL